MKKIPIIVRDIRENPPTPLNFAVEKNISYSQLSMFTQCPKKWALQYRDGHKTSEQSIHMTFGTALHEVLHSATVAQMLNPNKTAKGKKAYKELTLLQDKVNDYISEKGKEWQRGFDSSYFTNLKRQKKHESAKRIRTQQV